MKKKGRRWAKTLLSTVSGFSLLCGVLFHAVPAHAITADPNAPSPSDPTIAPSACDPTYYETLEARAWLEAQREITQNQNLITKPMSVLQYSCFNDHAMAWQEASKQMFSHESASGLSTAIGMASSFAGSGAFSGAVGGAAGAVGGAAGGITGAVGGIGSGIGGIAGGIGSGIGGIAGGIGNGIGGIAGGIGNGIGGIAGGIGNGIGGIAGGIGNGLGGALGGVGNFVLDGAGNIVNTIGGAAGSIVNTAGGALGGLGSGIPGANQLSTGLNMYNSYNSGGIAGLAGAGLNQFGGGIPGANQLSTGLNMYNSYNSGGIAGLAGAGLNQFGGGIPGANQLSTGLDIYNSYNSNGLLGLATNQNVQGFGSSLYNTIAPNSFTDGVGGFQNSFQGAFGNTNINLSNLNQATAVGNFINSNTFNAIQQGGGGGANAMGGIQRGIGYDSSGSSNAYTTAGGSGGNGTNIPPANITGSNIVNGTIQNAANGGGITANGLVNTVAGATNASGTGGNSQQVAQPQASTSCAVMDQAWAMARCSNFINDPAKDGFYTLNQYAFGAADLRFSCSKSPMWETEFYNANDPAYSVKNIERNGQSFPIAAGTKWTEDITPPFSELFKINEEAAAQDPDTRCAASAKVPTGLVVSQSVTPAYYEEFTCLTPGCFYKPRNLTSGSCVGSL